MATDDVDSWRRRISQKVEDIQGLIESAKFESGDLQVDAIQKCTGDAQLVFVLLLSLARHWRDISQPNVVVTAAVEVENTIAAVLEAIGMRVGPGSEPAVLQLENALKAFEHFLTGTDGLDAQTAAHFRARIGLYRALIETIKQLSLESLKIWQEGHGSVSSNMMLFERQESSAN